MNTLLSPFVEGLLGSSAPLSEQLQLNVYRSLVARKLWAPLGRLAARTDLSDELDALLDSRKEVDVVVGWVSRPGRSTEAILAKLSGEKRVKALLVIASRTDLPDTVYRGIARNPSKTLAEELVRNTSVPRDVRIAKAAELVNSSARNSWRFRNLFSREIADVDEDFTREVAALVTSLPGMALMLDITTPSRETILAYCDIAVAVKHDSDEGYYSRGSEYEELLIELSQHRLDDRRRKLLRAALTRAARDNTNWSYLRGRLVEAAETLRMRNVSVFDRLELFEAETDPATATVLFEELRTSECDSALLERVMASAVRHRHLPVEAVFPYFESLNFGEQHALAVRCMQTGAYELLARAALEAYYSPSWLSDLSKLDVDRFLVALSKVVSETDSEFPRWVLSMSGVEGRSATLVETVPWPQLVRAMPDMPELAAEIAERLRSQVETHPTFWENFETLADEFEGTLPDLIDAASAL